MQNIYEVDRRLDSVRHVVAYLINGRKRATKYLSPSLVVKGSCRHKSRRNGRTIEIVLTVGRPNWSEREFIKKAKKAGEPFPIRKLQLKNWPGK